MQIIRTRPLRLDMFRLVSGAVTEQDMFLPQPVTCHCNHIKTSLQQCIKNICELGENATQSTKTFELQHLKSNRSSGIKSVCTVSTQLETWVKQ